MTDTEREELEEVIIDVARRADAYGLIEIARSCGVDTSLFDPDEEDEEEEEAVYNSTRDALRKLSSKDLNSLADLLHEQGLIK